MLCCRRHLQLGAGIRVLPIGGHRLRVVRVLACTNRNEPALVVRTVQQPLRHHPTQAAHTPSRRVVGVWRGRVGQV
eukprot:1011014-Prorocentrum_minimum.AAC.1